MNRIAISYLNGTCLKAFTVEQGAVLTQEQVAMLGYGPSSFSACSSIGPNITGQLSALSQSGWISECTAFLDTEACAGFLKLGNVSNSGIGGFSAPCIGAFALSSLTLLNASQIGHFGKVNPKSCAGWTAAELQSIPAEKYAGWSSDCVLNQPDIFWECAAGGMVVSRLQAANLGAQGFRGLSGDRINDLVGCYFELLDDWTLQQVATPGLNVSARVAQLANATDRQFCIGAETNMSAVTWTQVVYSATNATNCLTEQKLTDFPDISITGIRADQIPDFSTLSKISLNQAGQLTCLAIAALNISEIPPESFGFVNWVYASDPSLVSKAQLVNQKSVFPKYLISLPCPFIHRLPSFFFSTLKTVVGKIESGGKAAVKRYDQYRTNCTVVDPTLPLLPCSGSQLNLISPSGPPEWALIVGLVILGVGVGASIIAFAFYWYRRKRTKFQQI